MSLFPSRLYGSVGQLGAANKPPGIIDDFDTFNPAKWTAVVGTAGVVAGKLRGLTQGDVGNNLVSNGEFTANVTGWAANANAAISKVDSSVEPGVASGGADVGVGRLIKVGATADARAAQTITYLPGSIVKFSTLAYAKSINTAIQAAYLFLYQLPSATLYNVQVPVEDTWRNISVTTGATADTSISARLYISGTTAGDLVYFDSVNLYRQNTILLLNGWSSVNGVETLNVSIPATGVAPRGFVARYTDVLNHWEVQLRPNTAGSDIFIFEIIAGVATSRGAPVHVGWTAGQIDQIRITLAGTAIMVEKKLYGAGSWSAAINYATMATGLASTQNGLMLYGINADYLDRFEIAG